MCKQAVPSVTTLAAVCLGLKAIACARQAIALDRQQADEWVENACWFIVAAFAIDFFDGALARLLNACSAIGGALDFLADSTAENARNQNFGPISDLGFLFHVYQT